MQNKPPNKMSDPSEWALHNTIVLGIAHDYGVKSDRRDGTTHVIFEPLDYRSRSTSLVPKSRVNLT
jgi:hypothetical protein